MSWFSLAITSALFSSFAAVLQKKGLKEIDALEFSFLISSFGIVWGILIFIANTNLFYQVEISYLFLLFVKSILGALAFLNVMEALKRFEISQALPLLTTTPFFVSLFAFIFLGESMTVTQILGMVLLVLGVMVLELKFQKNMLLPTYQLLKSKNRKYIFYALTFFTITAILDKYIITRSNITPYFYVGIHQIFLFLIFSFLMLIKKKNFAFAKSKTSIFWFSLFGISLFTLTYRITLISAIELASVGLVLSIKRLSVLFASIIGGKLFQEEDLLKRNVAIIIILFSIFLILYR